MFIIQDSHITKILKIIKILLQFFLIYVIVNISEGQ